MRNENGTRKQVYANALENGEKEHDEDQRKHRLRK